MNNEIFNKLEEDGQEFWSTRDLQQTLGYIKWQKFQNAIQKGIKNM